LYVYVTIHGAKTLKKYWFYLFIYFLFIWEELIAHLQILTVKMKAKYKFSHDHVILYTKKL